MQQHEDSVTAVILHFPYSVYTESDPFMTHFWFSSVCISSSRREKYESEKYFFVFIIPR